MAKEAAGDEEDDAGCSAEPGVQEPEARRGYFFEKAADPADEIVRAEQVQRKDADDRGGQRGRRDACLKRKRDGEDICKTNAVQDVEGDEPADRNFSSGTFRDPGKALPSFGEGEIAETTRMPDEAAILRINASSLSVASNPLWQAPGVKIASSNQRRLEANVKRTLPISNADQKLSLADYDRKE
jgi:hypothetical protein